ncbi:hypothetical protein D9756_001705 [Leucocoprinus leucothites]|uniref:Uncharacterized protein n=1 Tax=Leucocoprinus leucothites TaxID=201217 RepID=A0A8H5LI62_9AGAR|nr:hypothetical protein D9756_001705 [Leucoagaricus leucothites]
MLSLPHLPCPMPLNDFWSTPPLDLSDFPPSPSETSSSSSTDSSPTLIRRPRSAPLHVVCNAPLVAPIPLPYHSPTFLQFDLPDMDEDLSRPPYIKQALKRKRDLDEQPDAVPAKRSLRTRTKSIPSMPPASRRSKQHPPQSRHSNTRLLQRPF